MKRREFIALVGTGAVAWPFAVRAQQPAMPVVAVLSEAVPSESDERGRDAVRRGLDESGYADGRNVAVEFYLVDAQRMASIMAVLVARNVAVIVTVGGVAAISAKTATASIPIVFGLGGDPVSLGLVASLNRPGGNVTGVTNINAELDPKRLELLAELIPGATTIAALVNPSSATIKTKLPDLEAASQRLGRRLRIFKADTATDFEPAFATVVEERIGALIIASDAFFNSQVNKLAGLAVRHAVPSIYAGREFPTAGGLASYGANIADQMRQVGIYAGRILKGDKPADLPVMRAAKFEFIINLQTAKTLGLTIPPSMLARADEVIE